MSDFERIYQTDPSRESDQKTEKHPSIELSDKEYLRKNEFITLINKPPLIPMKLEMPMLEKAIKEGKRNEKNKSKTTKQKPNRNDKKAKQTAVAIVQKEL